MKGAIVNLGYMIEYLELVHALQERISDAFVDFEIDQKSLQNKVTFDKDVQEMEKIREKFLG
jgi:hypothetical protein